MAAGFARVFAIAELWIITGALVVLVVVCVLWVRSTTVRIRLHRSVSPSRIHTDDVARVTIVATNVGRNVTPVVQLSDPVAGTRGAQLQLAPLGLDKAAEAAYRMPTNHRGVLSVGPLTLELTDPFGIARRRAIAAERVDVLVFPKVEALGMPRMGGDLDPHGSAMNVNRLAPAADETFSLRPYQLGDDLRRVHWKSTARTGELIVRQDESAWQDCTTVALDVRVGAHDAESFERAVSAAASIVTSAFADRHIVRLLTSADLDTGSGSGSSHEDALMSTLATVCVGPSASLRSMVETLRQTGEGGLGVVVLGRVDSTELAALAAMAHRFRQLVVVVHNGQTPQRASVQRMTVIALGDAGELSERWSAAVRMGRRVVPA